MSSQCHAPSALSSGTQRSWLESIKKRKILFCWNRRQVLQQTCSDCTDRSLWANLQRAVLQGHNCHIMLFTPNPIYVAPIVNVHFYKSFRREFRRDSSTAKYTGSAVNNTLLRAEVPSGRAFKGELDGVRLHCLSSAQNHTAWTGVRWQVNTVWSGSQFTQKVWIPLLISLFLNTPSHAWVNWLTDWLTDRPTDWLTDWLTD